MVDKAFNCQRMEVFQGSDLGEILFLDINFHQLNLTRVNSQLPLPGWI